MFFRIFNLLRSNLGRQFGWYIEFNGLIVGELRNPSYHDMYWDSYDVVPTDDAGNKILTDDQHWLDGTLQFRNKNIDEYAFTAIAADTHPVVKNSKVLMRSLYLMPNGRLEETLFRFLGIFIPHTFFDKSTK